jgi:hypothetical protein
LTHINAASPIDEQSSRALNFTSGSFQWASALSEKQHGLILPRSAVIWSSITLLRVRSESVLRAMRAVRREEFLPSNLREFAYEDSPLPIASGQTISQPLCVPKTSSAEIPVPAPKFPVPPMASALFAPR